MLTKPDKIKLFTLMGNYPNAMALKEGKLASGIVDFDFADVKVSNTAFKPLVREAKFDLAEVAIVTFLQARTYGKPYALIPATVVGRGQLHTIAYNPERGELEAVRPQRQDAGRARLYPDHGRVGARHPRRGLRRRSRQPQMGDLRGRPRRRIRRSAQCAPRARGQAARADAARRRARRGDRRRQVPGSAAQAAHSRCRDRQPQMVGEPWRRSHQPHAGHSRGAGEDPAGRGARGLPARSSRPSRPRSRRPACRRSTPGASASRPTGVRWRSSSTSRSSRA